VIASVGLGYDIERSSFGGAFSGGLIGRAIISYVVLQTIIILPRNDTDLVKVI
jgi:hypothetical protein